MTPKCDRTIKVVRFERTLLIEFAKDNLRIIQLKEVLTAYSVNGYLPLMIIQPILIIGKKEQKECQVVANTP